MNPSRLRLSIVVITLAGLLLALVLALDLIPFLRGGFGWQWPYEPAPLARAVPLVALTLAYLAVAWLLVRLRHTWPLLAWGMAGVIVLTLSVMALREDDLTEALFLRTVSGVTTGPHFAAAEVDWSGAGRYDWPTVMAGFDGRSGHVSVSPPGLPMWYGFLNDVAGSLPPALTSALQRALMPYQCHNYRLLAYTPAQWASAWFGMLMPLWAALAVLPLFGVAQRVAGPWGRYAVVWWPLVPALVAFSPTWSTVYPLFSLTAFWLFDAGISRRRGATWLVASGALTGLAIFGNFAFVPFIGVFGFYTLARYLLVERRETPPRAWLRPFIVGLWFAVGLALPWLVYWAASGLTFFDVFLASMDLHLELDRPYLPWMWLHFWDWVLWSGLPMMLLWWGGIVAWARKREGDPPLLAIALACTIMVLTVSGTARGESGRVWLVFTPFAIIAAVDGLRRLAAVQWLVSLRSASAVTLAQAAVMLVLTVALSVINAPDLSPRPPSPGPVAAEQPGGAQFDTQFRLLGWDAEADGNAITLRLNWQADRQLTTPYWFSALLVGPDGTTATESQVWQPLDTRYPTTCWLPGETVGETVTLPLPANAQPGDWWISLASFADDTASERLPVTLRDGTTDTQVGLGPVPVD